MERPPFGYFTQMRIHETSRPRPKSYTFEFKDANIGTTKEFQEGIKKLGERSEYSSPDHF